MSPRLTTDGRLHATVSHELPRETAEPVEARPRAGRCWLDTARSLLDLRSPVPLYHQLSLRLAEAVEAGDLRAGDRLEGELVIADRLGLSRATVSHAIGTLVERGLLERRQGIGTTVTGPAD